MFLYVLGSLPKIFGTGQPKIIETPESMVNGNQAMVLKSASPAIIVPIYAFGHTLVPMIDRYAYPTNVSVSIGRTAYLRCRIKNLGHKSVRIFLV